MCGIQLDTSYHADEEEDGQGCAGGSVCGALVGLCGRVACWIGSGGWTHVDTRAHTNAAFRIICRIICPCLNNDSWCVCGVTCQPQRAPDVSAAGHARVGLLAEGCAQKEQQPKTRKTRRMRRTKRMRGPSSKAVGVAQRPRRQRAASCPLRGLGHLHTRWHGPTSSAPTCPHTNTRHAHTHTQTHRMNTGRDH